MKRCMFPFLGIVLAASLSTSAAPPLERSLSAEYRAALNSLLPLTTPADERFWAQGELMWWATIRVLPSSRDDREVQITIWTDRVGKVHGVVRFAVQSSIFRQVKAAYDTNAPSNVGEIEMANVDVSNTPELKVLVASLEQVRQAPLPDSGLIMDPQVYDFLALSQSGSIKLHMLAAPGSVQKKKSLIRWIDKATDVFLKIAMRDSRSR